MPAGSARLSGAKKGLEQHTRPMLSRTCDTCSGRAGGLKRLSCSRWFCSREPPSGTERYCNNLTFNKKSLKKNSRICLSRGIEAFC